MTNRNHPETKPYDPKTHRRRSIRLKGYDYTTPGAYFITICTFQRKCLFGEILDEEMVLNDYGTIARDEWLKTADLRQNVELFPDEFVVMPNHVHGIIWLIDPESVESQSVGARCIVPLPMARPVPPPAARNIPPPTQEQFSQPVPGSIPTIVRSYKAAVTKQIGRLLNSPGIQIWQSNYYEHIIRNERELHAIQEYILANPLNWRLDNDNPININA